MFGGTPSNISLSFLEERSVAVVTGINLPMLIKLATLREEKPLDELAGFIKEYGRRNIRVNAICPGPFLTPMNEPIANTEEGKKFVVGATALKRWGELSEIQGSAIYLASDAASSTTGSMLVVDGGWTAR